MKLHRTKGIAGVALFAFSSANVAGAATPDAPPSAAFPEEPSATPTAPAPSAATANSAPSSTTEPPPVTAPPALRGAEARPTAAVATPQTVVAPSPGDAASDPDAVFRAFDTFASQVRLQRTALSLSGMALGAGTMIIGGVLANDTNSNPDPWYIIGGVAIGASALGLFMPSRPEALATQLNAGTPGHSAAQAAALESSWKSMAQDARGQRYVGSVISLVFGAGTITAGALILSGTGDFSQNDRDAWGSILIGTGAGLAVAGVTQLFLPTPTEAAYAQYAATRPNHATLQLSLGGPGGPGLSARGTF